ncbi:MAG: DUF2802 domain-containing protein [Chromatiaceae bacterium]|mgnify:CR=1 FL=1|nr:DUF2802 domain-containing protein [Chromatiaceae bacterium]
MWLSLAIHSTLLLFVAAGILWWVRAQQRQSQQHQSQLEQRLEYSAQQFAQSQLELQELRSGLIGVGQRVLQLEASLGQVSENLSLSLKQLAEKQQAMELTDPESKIYSRAMKMVQLGADLDEIMRECELPRAEAELLFNLHQAKS